MEGQQQLAGNWRKAVLGLRGAAQQAEAVAMAEQRRTAAAKQCRGGCHPGECMLRALRAPVPVPKESDAGCCCEILAVQGIAPYRYGDASAPYGTTV